jgi:hypothetical protein
MLRAIGWTTAATLALGAGVLTYQASLVEPPTVRPATLDLELQPLPAPTVVHKEVHTIVDPGPTVYVTVTPAPAARPAAQPTVQDVGDSGSSGSRAAESDGDESEGGHEGDHDSDDGEHGGGEHDD